MVNDINNGCARENLLRQNQRDRLIFFSCLILASIVCWSCLQVWVVDFCCCFGFRASLLVNGAIGFIGYFFGQPRRCWLDSDFLLRRILSEVLRFVAMLSWCFAIGSSQMRCCLRLFGCRFCFHHGRSLKVVVFDKM